MKGLVAICALAMAATLCSNYVCASNTPTYLEARNSYHAAYSTTFCVNDKPRRVNITQAAKSINGIVVNPGEEFSFNRAVGPTIEKRGYLPGRIFINGKDAIGVGGGVCQVSSTLFCAAINMGLKTTERHAHSKPVYYVPKGYDAATSYGGKDYKFVNNKHFPVIIETFVDGDTLTVAIAKYYSELN